MPTQKKEVIEILLTSGRTFFLLKERVYIFDGAEPVTRVGEKTKKNKTYKLKINKHNLLTLGSKYSTDKLSDIKDMCGL